MIKRLALAILVQVSAIYAGQADSLSYSSPLLGMIVPYVVILPHSYAQDVIQGKRFPVLYLLHCAGCSHLTWLQPGYGNLITLIDSVDFIAVAPSDNERFGWWLDSPVRPNYAHSRFLKEELKPKIDSLYATLPGRLSTGVTGWSMGGFGALHNVIRHPDVFASGFSIKGGVDPTLPLNPLWGGNFGLYNVLGNAPADSVNWNAVNILQNIYRLKTDSVRLGAYSGRNDAWFAVENRRLDTIMTGLSMPHLFFETNEDHYGIPDSSMFRVLRFFDSLFVHSPAAIRPRADFNAQTQRRMVQAGNVVWYDIRGRRLATFAAPDKRDLYNTPGIRIAVMPYAVYRVLFHAAVITTERQDYEQ